MEITSHFSRNVGCDDTAYRSDRKNNASDGFFVFTDNYEFISFLDLIFIDCSYILKCLTTKQVGQQYQEKQKAK